MNYELYHYGVKGMKWGVRRYQNKDGSLTAAGKKRYSGEKDFIIKKGTVVKRVSTSRADPTYDNKKYVSINDADHAKWEEYLGRGYVELRKATWTQTYKTVKDLKVMSVTKQGEMYVKQLENAVVANMAREDTDYANRFLGLKPTDDVVENLSRNIAAQTDTGRNFTNAARRAGYDAIFDKHGTNTAESPVIILDPDSKLHKAADPEYTQAVKDYLKRLGIAG